MRNITLLLIFLGLLLSVQSYAQIPTVLKESDFSTKTGVFKDQRDGKYYHYKKYGTRDWFMQNLNWNNNDKAGWAGPEDLDGSMYGRFYKVNTVSTFCPEGWHSPSNKEMGELINAISAERSLPNLKATASNYYDLHMAMHYMRGGGLASAGGLWLSGTGTQDIAQSNAIQFNILPSGNFNGSGYTANSSGGGGIGQRTYIIGSNNDVYRNYHMGGDAPGSAGRNTLKHHTSTSSYGVVRCVRDAQVMRDQVIIAEEIEPKALIDAEFDLPAKATSGLAMICTSSNTAVATVDANGKVTIHAVGETTITMTQPGDAEFNPADTESRVLVVHPKKFYITLPTVVGAILSPATANNIIVGDSPFEFSVTRISGYEGEPVVQLSTGGNLTPVSQVGDTYKYEIKDIASNISVTITGITKAAVVGLPRFGTISDIQAGATDWEAKATKALDNLIAQTPKLDAIFVTGDITAGGTQAQLELVKNLVNSKVPSDILVYYGMGNDDWKASATLSGEYFNKTMEQDLNKFIDIRGYPFITISVESKDQSSSYLVQTRDFLNEKLEYAANQYPGKPIFVIQHVPNYQTVYGSASNQWGTSSLKTDLEKYPQVVSISGNSQYFLANELSIHQDKFTSINAGSIAFGRMETGLDDGITPLGSETISEGSIVTVGEDNSVEVKRIDFTNNKEIKQAWTIEAPHDASKFAYKGRTGGAVPYFESGAVITITDLTDITFKLEVPVAKDDDEVTQYLIEILDIDQKPLLKPIFKFVSDYYLATSAPVATTISKDVSRLVESTDYYVRITAIDAFGQKSTPLLSDKITTKAKDITNPSEFDIMADRIRADQESRFSTTTLDASVDNSLNKYAATGSFTDLNYGGTSADVWSSAVGPPVHLNRLKDMAMAYVRPDSKYFENDDLHAKIVAATEYWYTRRPSSSNWWHGSLGNPTKMGIFLLEMRKGKKKLPASTEAMFLYRMEHDVTDDRQPEKDVNEGANRSDIALHFFYRACLTGDDALTKRAVLNGYEPTKITNKEGIQVDNSYFQHGQQFQLASYGQEYLNGTVSLMSYTAGTEYIMPAAQLEIFSKYVRKAYFNNIRGSHIHFNSTGRSISRAGNLKRFGNARFAKALIDLDPTHKTEYEIIYKRVNGDEPASFEIKPNNTSYFVADFVTHTRPEFQFSVRTVSSRTVRSEWGNGEALQTYFMSDGTTSFLQKGDEYENIPVGWNWTRLPGTTAPQYPFESIPQWTADFQPGESNFVGGVSDSIYSANTFYLTDTWKDNIAANPTPKHAVNTNGYKSWFFFDNEVVALGAGITSTCFYPVNTTVEQNLLKTDVIVSTTDQGEETIAQAIRGEKSYTDNLKWVLHNGAGYYFPRGGKVHTENVTTTRSWSEINKSQSKTPVNTDVFSLWFDHGQDPVDATYAYIVVPNKTTATEMNSYDASNIEILSNTADIQAVKDKKANILQMIFFKAAKFEHDGITIETDAGAAIILKNIGTPEVTMHIADPGQMRRPITVRSLIPSVSDKTKQTACNFTGTGRYAGETKVYTINAQSEDATVVEPEKDPDIVYKSVVLNDTYVTDGSSEINKNFGTVKVLDIKLNDVAGYHRQSYVKFSLDDLDKYTDKENYDVKVFTEFFVTSANTGITSTNWVLTPVEDLTWVETEMTWNNKPATGAEIIASTRAFAPKAGTIVPHVFDLENRADFDITEYALSEYAKGNKIISLNINNDIPGAKVNSTFASREHDDTQVYPVISVRLYKKGGSVTLKDQTITFPAIDPIIVGAIATAAATADSGLKVTYTSSDPTVATIDAEGVITALKVGTTIITASQTGDTEYKPATEATVSVTVKEAPVVIKEQTITFPAIDPITVGGTATAAATATSGLKVTYTSTVPSIATIDASTGVITALKVGVTTIIASQAGNAEYSAANKTMNVTVKEAPVVLKDQTITFPAIDPITVGGTATAAATATSGLKVTYTSSDVTVATINAEGVITALKAGPTTITASQAGNAEYSAATNKTMNVTVKEAVLPGEIVLTVNGQVWDETSQYTISCADNVSQVKLEVDEASGAKIKLADKEATSHTVNLGIAPIQTISFSVIPQSGTPTNHSLVVNKGINFDDITVTKWGNTYIVNKDPQTNGGLTITGYKWFENGAFVSTKQYYEATKGGTAAEYSVELTTTNGIVRTCPATKTPRIVLINVYPNPVKVGEPIYIDASQMPEDFFADAKAYLYSLAGYTVKEQAVREKVSSVETPMTPGAYVLKIVSKTYSKEFKVIIK